jgi:hypothetical protein
MAENRKTAKSGEADGEIIVAEKYHITSKVQYNKPNSIQLECRTWLSCISRKARLFQGCAKQRDSEF